MFLSKKVIVSILLFVGIPGFAWAQRGTIKPDGFVSRLRVGGQAYVVANKRVGQEALEAGMRSRVGMVPITKKDKLKYKGYALGQKHLSPVMLERLVARQLVKVPFPAYYIDFEEDWRQAREKDQVTLRQLEVVLEAAYGIETEFEGAFVASYKEVLDHLQQVKDTFTAQGALRQAFTQGCQKRNGFFVITVHETEEHGHDVLLLDLKHTQFISVGKSIGEAWEKYHAPTQK